MTLSCRCSNCGMELPTSNAEADTEADENHRMGFISATASDGLKWDRWYASIPADIRRKLSLHDFKRLGDLFDTATAPRHLTKEEQDIMHKALRASTAAAEVGERSRLSTLMDEMTDKHITRARTEDRNWQQIIEDRTAAAEVDRGAQTGKSLTGNLNEASLGENSESVLHNHTIERCAKVVDEFADHAAVTVREATLVAAIAAAIRAIAK